MKTFKHRSSEISVEKNSNARWVQAKAKLSFLKLLIWARDY